MCVLGLGDCRTNLLRNVNDGVAGRKSTNRLQPKASFLSVKEVQRGKGSSNARKLSCSTGSGGSIVR